MNKILATAATAALLVGAAQASAATLLIDGFDTDQRVTDVPDGTDVNNSEVPTPNALGGFRELAVSNDDGLDDGTELRVSGSRLSFSNIDATRGAGSITYDGAGNAGLGGVNFLIGSNPFLLFSGVNPDTFDRNATVGVNVRDTNGLNATYSEQVEMGFNPQLDFGLFTTDAGFDFGSVDSLMFTVSSTNTEDSVDGSLGAISVEAGDIAPVPLPASALLLMGGIGGLSAFRARRRKA